MDRELNILHNITFLIQFLTVDPMARDILIAYQNMAALFHHLESPSVTFLKKKSILMMKSKLITSNQEQL